MTTYIIWTYFFDPIKDQMELCPHYYAFLNAVHNNDDFQTQYSKLSTIKRVIFLQNTFGFIKHEYCLSFDSESHYNMFILKYF